MGISALNLASSCSSLSRSTSRSSTLLMGTGGGWAALTAHSDFKVARVGDASLLKVADSLRKGCVFS